MTPLLNDYDTLVTHLRRALLGTLPGPAAQQALSPRPRSGWVPGAVPAEARTAAALLLVHEREGRPHVLLTQRRPDLAAHPGQLSLPGGGLEGQESVAEAALREAREEVGLDPSTVGILGELTALHIPASGFVLHPVVGAAAAVGPLVASAAEVTRILHVPVADLADGRLLGVERWNLRRGAADVPFFRLGELRLWGATAMILAEFLALIDVPPDPWSAAGG